MFHDPRPFVRLFVTDEPPSLSLPKNISKTFKNSESLVEQRSGCDLEYSKFERITFEEAKLLERDRKLDPKTLQLQPVGIRLDGKSQDEFNVSSRRVEARQTHQGHQSFVVKRRRRPYYVASDHHTHVPHLHRRKSTQRGHELFLKIPSFHMGFARRAAEHRRQSAFVRCFVGKFPILFREVVVRVLQEKEV